MLDYQGPGVVQQDLLRHSAELRKRAFQSVEPALLSLVAKRPDVMPARITERGNEQIRAHFAAADLDQALTKIDLHLLARRCLKPHRRPRLRRKFLAIPLHRPRRLTVMLFSAASSWRITSALPLGVAEKAAVALPDF